MHVNLYDNSFTTLEQRQLLRLFIFHVSFVFLNLCFKLLLSCSNKGISLWGINKVFIYPSIYLSIFTLGKSLIQYLMCVYALWGPFDDFCQLPATLSSFQLCVHFGQSVSTLLNDGDLRDFGDFC